MGAGKHFFNEKLFFTHDVPEPNYLPQGLEHHVKHAAKRAPKAAKPGAKPSTKTPNPSLLPRWQPHLHPSQVVQNCQAPKVRDGTQEGTWGMGGVADVVCARCTHTVYTWVVAWTVRADLEGTCYWRTCRCPEFDLALQHCRQTWALQPYGGLGLGCTHLSSFHHALPYLFAEQLPPRHTICKGFKGGPLFGEVAQMLDTQCVNSLLILHVAYDPPPLL